MKLLIVLCLVAVVAAAPPPRTEGAQLLKYKFDNQPDGSFAYAFEQTDGTKSEQTGVLRNVGTENESLAVSGSFSWVGPDGVTYKVTYTADEQGYKPEVVQGYKPAIGVPGQPGQPGFPGQPGQPGWPGLPAGQPPSLVASLLG